MQVKAMVAAAGAFVVAALVGSAAWACVFGPVVSLSTATARPGQEVTVILRDFRKVDPVVVRWNTAGGPVLATFGHDAEGGQFVGKFTVPAAATPGPSVVFFTQTTPDGKVSQMPVRAALEVTSPAHAIAPTHATRARPRQLTQAAGGIGASTFLLVVLLVAGAGLIAARIAATVARGPA